MKITFKEFFKKHNRLNFSIQHLDIHGGVWMIRIYDTSWISGEKPIFRYFISDFEVDNINADIETVIMTPIINWYEHVKEDIDEHTDYITKLTEIGENSSFFHKNTDEESNKLKKQMCEYTKKNNMCNRECELCAWKAEEVEA